MDNTLICQIDLFNMYQMVIYPDKHKDYILLQELDTVLPVICHQNDYSLHLYGNAEFLTGLVERIRQDEETEYSENKLRIEIN